MTRIVIGGSPHSGKSTFMVLLKQNLKGKNVDVGLNDLDLSSPTLEWLEGEETKYQRELKKQPWTPELAKQAKYIFTESEKKHDIVLGDSPGKITDVTKIISKGADGAVILTRDPQNRKSWNKFYKENKIPVLCDIDSDLFGKSRFSPKVGKGKAVGLSRQMLRKGKLKERNMAIEGCAFELGEKFGLTFEGGREKKQKIDCSLPENKNFLKCIKERKKHSKYQNGRKIN